MHENDITTIILNTCFEIHKELGPGLFESVYEEILVLELRDKGLVVDVQKRIPIIWKGQLLKKEFIIDLIVENKVLVELKSIATLEKVHYKQVHTYLKLTKLKLGLLINFNEELLRNGIHRIVNGL